MNDLVNLPPAKRKKNFFERNMIPLKGDSKKTRKRKGLFNSCLIIVLISALVLVWVVVIDPNAAIELSDELSDLHGGAPAVTQSTKPGQTVPETTRKVVEVRQSADKLMARNSHYIGWLIARGGNINMPIVQTKDNDYYLRRNFDRAPSKYGCPFVDYRVSFDPMSTNLIIYGHHMNNGTIFSKLTRYKSADAVKANPLITLELPDGTTYQYKIFAVLAVNGLASDDNGYVFAANTPDFPNKTSFEGFVRQLKQRSYVNTGVDVQYGDQLISLQTCIYDFDYEFLYVVGRLVRPGESAAVSAAQIKANPNPRLPQALYDKQKRKNPFKDAERWKLS